MKRTSMIFLLIVVLALQSVLSLACAETHFYDKLYERGIERGDSVPSSGRSLPYTGSWNSVSYYTNTNYYFTGYSKLEISLDVQMNYYAATGRFRVYLIDLDNNSSSVCVLDSGTAQFSYSGTTTRNVDSSHRYYLKFSITDNTRSCWGDMSIDVG